MSDKPGSAPAIDYSSFNHPHPLVKIDTPGGIRCDVCRQSKTPTWRCVGCNYDECTDCFPRTQSRPGTAPAASTGGSFDVATCWRLLNEARDSILPEHRGSPSWSMPSSMADCFERLRAAEGAVPSSIQSASFMSNRSAWVSAANSPTNQADFIRLLREFETGINASAQGSWDRSGWVSRCDAAAASSGSSSGGSGTIGTLWNLLNEGRNSINPDARGSPSNWNTPTSMAELYQRLLSAEQNISSSNQSSGFMSSRSTWVSAANDASSYSPAHFIRLLKEFEVGINASAQGSWDRSGWISRCDAAAALPAGGGGGFDCATCWRLLNEARDSILPEHRGSPSNWTLPNSAAECFERLRAAEGAVPSSIQSAGFMSNRSQWVSEANSCTSQADFIRLLKAFEVGINASAQGSWDRSGWVSRADAAAAGGGSSGGAGGDVSTLWTLLNQGRDSILPEHRGSPSNWSAPSSMADLYERLRSAEQNISSSNQSASFMSNRSTWVSAANDSSSFSAAHFIRLLKEFEVGINASAQGSWDRSGWISRCDAAAAGGGGGAPAIDYSSIAHPHPLVKQDLGHQVRCDVCKQSKQPTWRCTGCNYDECESCFPRTRSQAGSSGPDYSSFCHSHPLIRTDHSGTRTCDVCRTSASTTYMCAGCNYDECTACFPRTRSTAGSAPPPPAAVSDKDGGAPAAAGGADKGAAPVMAGGK